MKTKKFIMFLFLIMVSGIGFAEQKQKYVNLKYEVYVTEQSPSDAVKKNQKRKKSESTQASSAPAINCHVAISDILDIRQNKVTLGTNGYGPLFPAGLDQWLRSIKKFGLEEKTHKWSGDKKILVKPALTKLYGYVEDPNIYGVFSLTVEISVDNKTPIIKKYRGIGSTINMVNRYSDYAGVLNNAVHEVMPRVVNDLLSICTSN